MALLDVRDLSVRFDTPAGVVRAVDGVTFRLEAGETLGLVGESGSGKSVTSLALLDLVPSPPGTIDGGEVEFEGLDLRSLAPRERRRLRGRRMAMVFQDPMSSLNPLLTVGRQLTEVLEVHEGLSSADARRRSAAGLGEVGIPAPEKKLASYPHELSGGMRQRVMIAMALLCRPALLIADEPTTALDVTIQAQILGLLRDVQDAHGTAILLITHDLGVVAEMAHRVHVMYAGRLVETGPTSPLFAAPAHPYTRGLLTSVPDLSTDPTKRLATIEGQPPDLAALPAGCAFAPRCAVAVEECAIRRPALTPTGSDESGRCVACEVSALQDG